MAHTTPDRGTTREIGAQSRQTQSHSMHRLPKERQSKRPRDGRQTLCGLSTPKMFGTTHPHMRRRNHADTAGPHNERHQRATSHTTPKRRSHGCMQTSISCTYMNLTTCQGKPRSQDQNQPRTKSPCSWSRPRRHERTHAASRVRDAHEGAVGHTRMHRTRGSHPSKHQVHACTGIPVDPKAQRQCLENTSGPFNEPPRYTDSAERKPTQTGSVASGGAPDIVRMYVRTYERTYVSPTRHNRKDGGDAKPRAKWRGQMAKKKIANPRHLSTTPDYKRASHPMHAPHPTPTATQHTRRMQRAYVHTRCMLPTDKGDEC